MASFNSATFLVETTSYQESRPARVPVQEIPGGDTFYVDRAGRGPMRVVFGFLADATNWGTLNSATCLGASGSLAIEGLTTHTATLVSVSAPLPDLVGQILGHAEFLVTDA